MSREIKFRAWNDVAKVMYPSNIPGLLIHFDGELNGLDENGMLEGTDNTRQHHLMQYTGLKDDNGKEIYEGDIVKTHDQNNVIEYEHGSFLVKGLHADEYERTYSVLYHYLVDATIPDMPHSRFDGVTTTLEVIGNIYENPELLEATA